MTTTGKLATEDRDSAPGTTGKLATEVGVAKGRLNWVGHSMDFSGSSEPGCESVMNFVHMLVDAPRSAGGWLFVLVYTPCWAKPPCAHLRARHFVRRPHLQPQLHQ